MTILKNKFSNYYNRLALIRKVILIQSIFSVVIGAFFLVTLFLYNHVYVYVLSLISLSIILYSLYIQRDSLSRLINVIGHLLFYLLLYLSSISVFHGQVFGLVFIGLYGVVVVDSFSFWKKQLFIGIYYCLFFLLEEFVSSMYLDQVEISEKGIKIYLVFTVHILFNAIYYLFKDRIIIRDKKSYNNYLSHNFIANMSHQIRTPLNSILGITETFDKAHDNTQKNALLDMVRVSSLRLQGIFNDFIDLNKASSGKFRINNGSLDVSDFLNKLKNELLAYKGYRDNKVTFFIDDSIQSPVLTDEKVLKRAILNILKFHFENSTNSLIRINVYRTKKLITSSLIVEIKSDNSNDVFKNLNHLELEDFYYLSNNINGSHSFFGMLLAVELTRNLGGSMKILLNGGKGETFRISLPYKEALVDTEKAIPFSRNYNEIIKTVLLVEDDEVGCMVSKRILKSLGLEVFLATNGKEALDQVMNSHDTFDAVFMDIHMPVMDGLEATQKIRDFESDYDKLNVPIIALTANAMLEDDVLCREKGFDYYITKPFSKLDLVSILDKLV